VWKKAIVSTLGSRSFWQRDPYYLNGGDEEIGGHFTSVFMRRSAGRMVQ
jgi:hypothetical protein